MWIDHCTFSGYPDGLIDVTRGATDVTVSNSRFSEHRDVMLVNGEPDDGTEPPAADRARVTLHGNYFDGTFAGHPLARWAQVHLFNNYFRHWGTSRSGSAVQADAGAQVRSEFNVFEAGVRKRAVFSARGADPRARVAATGDLLLGGADVEEYLPGEVFDPSVAYGYLPELATRELAARIAADAGVYPPGAYPAAP